MECEYLTKLQWPNHNRYKNYYDQQHAPVDCGFVAALAALPHLASLVTEVGGRAVEAYCKLARSVDLRSLAPRKRKLKEDEDGEGPPLLPNLRVLREDHLTGELTRVLARACPGLRSIRVDWYNFYVFEEQSGEEWLKEMAKGEGQILPRLEEFRTSEVDFASPALAPLLPKIGERLTVLRLHEVFRFRYSYFRELKTHCPNLVTLAITMTSKNIITSLHHVKVEKDMNLQNVENPLPLKKLEEVHLIAPLGCDIVKYILWGAEAVRSLYLGVEWLLWLHQPSSSKDLLGVDYLKEILFVNPLPNLSELHLSAQFRRGRKKLDEACAYFILARFPRLRHLGNFEYWNLSANEVANLRMSVRKVNRDVTFDEDLFAPHHHNEAARFYYRYVPERRRLCCCVDPRLRRAGASAANGLGGVGSILPDIFDILGADVDSDDDDDDGEDLSDGSDDDSDGDEDDGDAPNGVQVAIAAAEQAVMQVSNTHLHFYLFFSIIGH